MILTHLTFLHIYWKTKGQPIADFERNLNIAGNFWSDIYRFLMDSIGDHRFQGTEVRGRNKVRFV
jgi:hypothetical protein